MYLSDDKGGLTGVVAIDSSIGGTVDKLNQESGDYETSYSFVAKADGEIIIHKNEEYIISLTVIGFAGRWGGEEFLILCPETGLAGAVDPAEKMCSFISLCECGMGKMVTISAGCSELRKDESEDDLVRQADENLYKAKKPGKNRAFG